MQDWLSYSLHDLLIFSEEAYFRLFELSNQALWPFQIPLLISALLVMRLIRSRHEYARHIILIWLSLIWLFVGLWFLNMFYSQINTLAKPLSYLFLTESFLLLMSGMMMRRKATYASANSWKNLAWVLLIYAYFLHPLSALVWERKLTGVELVAVAPDPTAIATIGFLLLLKPKGFIFLMIIPGIWIVMTIMTYLAF